SVLGALFAVAAGALLLAAASRKHRGWFALLFAATLTSACLAARLTLPLESPPAVELPPWEGLDRGRADLSRTAGFAYTDSGRRLGLVACDEHDFPAGEVRAGEQFIAHRFPLTLIRTAGPDPASNCHGWVFAGGRFWIDGSDVEIILADN